MVNKIKLITLLFLLLASVIPQAAFCSTEAAVYLCEQGVAFYRVGRYDEALHEFNKALVVEPDNQVAKSYISLIFLRIPSDFNHLTVIPFDKLIMNF